MTLSRSTCGWLLALVLVVGAGCETVIEVDAPPHTPSLVAHSFFTADSAWAVRVSHTVPYAGGRDPVPVEDAFVEIWAGDRLVARPARVDTGTYAATGPTAVPGVSYTLHVAAPGYDALAGEDALPLPPPVAAVREVPVPLADSLSRRQVTRVELTLDDPAGVENRYGLLVVQGRWREDRTTGRLTPLPPTLFTFESDDPALGERELDFLNLEKTLYREAFFDDAYFDGRRYTVDFDVQYDRPRPDAAVAIRRLLVVIVLSVSDDFYRYWRTATRQAFANENPFAEPLRVHSNLAGGHGIFAGFQYRLVPLAASDMALGGTTLAELCALVGPRLPLCPGGYAFSPF